MWTLIREARHNGIRVLKSRLMDERGLWLPNNNTVLIRADLDTPTSRSVLAHELGHAYYGDTHSTPPAERRADRWAANRLITPENIVRAALEHPDNPEQWCDHLEVTPDLLRAWMAQPTNYDRAEQLWRDST